MESVLLNISDGMLATKLDAASADICLTTQQKNRKMAIDQTMFHSMTGVQDSVGNQ
jgi:hypothetical protein